MPKWAILIEALLLGICLSCLEYTPKPRGYLRIEPPVPSYRELPLDELPYTFTISSFSEIELPPAGDPAGWINVSYPALGAKIYCSFLTIQPSTLDVAMEESRRLVARQSQDAHAITEQAYNNPAKQVYAYLYQLDGASVSPIQFTLTDSTARFFRGSLLYDRRPNGDSIAPVTQYLKTDIIELIQSFNWK
ncbi:MAG: gliding motility protein GldD [Tannerellaceae bacterium]|jgi:gliding motility-associated lipoprotein GldD|nr:gliding motility protein GldD [Tannerellaceae bacterium]